MNRNRLFNLVSFLPTFHNAISSLLLFWLLVFVSASASAQTSFSGPLIESTHLVNPDVGWARTGSKLFWTTNGGVDWKDITPTTSSPEKIAAVFFLDTSRAWVLLSAWENSADGARFDLASTTDAGTSWSITPIRTTDLKPAAPSLGGRGEVDFVDTVHGWVNLQVVNSSNFNIGVLLETDDGGRNWRRSPQSPGVFGPIRFVTIKHGWITGGVRDPLYVTHDGSNSWQELTLQAPPQARPAVYATYDLPVFNDDMHGFITVTYRGREGSHSKLVMFATDNGGSTWNPKTVLPAKQSDKEPSAICDSSLIAADLSDAHLELTKVTPSGKTTTSAEIAFKSLRAARGIAVAKLNFTDINHGWILAVAQGSSGRLLSTSNGGASWTDITPLGGKLDPAFSPSSPHSDLSVSEAEEVAKQITFAASPSPGAASTYTSLHLGFDQKCVAAVNDMQTWWTASPYFDVGIYIGGVNAGCKDQNSGVVNPNLTANWVASVTSQGWGLLPIWVGLQAAGSVCKTCSVMSPNPSEAKLQGVAEANNAASKASTLTIGGIIYYDLEQYICSDCGPSVAAFVSGWVSQLQKKHFQAGVYVNADNAQHDIVAASPLPTAIWIAQWNGKVTIWGLSPLADSPNWSNSQRAHQFNNIAIAIFGGVNLGSIDPDIEAAPVYGGNGKKSYVFSPADISDPSASSHSIANGINDSELIVGQYMTADGHEHGFLFDLNAYTTIDYPGATGTGTNANAVNNAGKIVGQYTNQPANQFDHWHGFVNDRGTFSSFDYPASAQTFAEDINDAGQIVGSYRDSVDNTLHGFLLSSGSFTTIDYPRGSETQLTGINGQGQIVGSFQDSQGRHGFLYYNGNFTKFDHPSGDTYPNGINSNGEIAGQYLTAGSLSGYGFLYNGVSFTDVGGPGGTWSGAFGLNDSPSVVGCWGDNSGCVGASLNVRP